MTADDAPSDRPARALDCRTIGGQVYVRQADVVAALRDRAVELDQLATDHGDIAGDHDDQLDYWQCAAPARELRERADELALAELGHQTEHPGDSVIHTLCKCCDAEIEYCPVCGCKLGD